MGGLLYPWYLTGWLSGFSISNVEGQRFESQLQWKLDKNRQFSVIRLVTRDNLMRPHEIAVQCALETIQHSHSTTIGFSVSDIKNGNLISISPSLTIYFTSMWFPSYFSGSRSCRMRCTFIKLHPNAVAIPKEQKSYHYGGVYISSLHYYWHELIVTNHLSTA